MPSRHPRRVSKGQLCLKDNPTAPPSCLRMIWAREHVLSATEHTVWEAEIDFALGRQPSWALLTQASEPPPGPQTLPQTLSQRVDSRLAASPTPLGPRLLCWKSVLKNLFFSKYLEKILNISKISEIFNNMVFFSEIAAQTAFDESY